MLTKELIDKFYEDVKSLELKFPVAAIAKKTGFSKGQVSTYLSKKDEPSEKFVEVFYIQFKDSLKKVPYGTSESGPKVEDALIALSKGDTSLFLQIMVNLSESNKSLSDSNKKLSDSNKVLADVQMMFAKYLNLGADGSVSLPVQESEKGTVKDPHKAPLSGKKAPQDKVQKKAKQTGIGAGVGK